VINIVAQFPIRNAGISYGARYYYGAWFCLVFITANFFVILAADAHNLFKRAGEAWAVALFAALFASNVAFYLPRAAARYAGRPWGNYSLWADAAVRAAVKELALNNAVVVIRPREWCLSSIPTSPFLDDDVIYARDAGGRNKELIQIFPARSIYFLDYVKFRRAGEIKALVENVRLSGGNNNR